MTPGHLGVLTCYEFTTFKAYFEFFESMEEAECYVEFGVYTVFYTCEYSCDTQCIQMSFNIP